MSNKPAHEIRRTGAALKVVIWRNTDNEGRNWYSVDVLRSYKKGDETWKETRSLGQDDILPARKLLDLADTWIMHQLQADAKARKEQAKQPTAA